jgi:hypothetical protein
MLKTNAVFGAQSGNIFSNSFYLIASQTFWGCHPPNNSLSFCSLQDEERGKHGKSPEMIRMEDYRSKHARYVKVNLLY